MQKNKFFKTLDALKASLSSICDPVSNFKINESMFDDGACDLYRSYMIYENHYIGQLMKPETFIIVNGERLAEILSTPLRENAPFMPDHKKFEINYKFEIINSCKIADYAKLIKDKSQFEENLPKTVKYATFFEKHIAFQREKYNASLEKPIVATVIDGDTFKEVKYTPVIGECQSWWNQIYNVEYTSEVLNECKISDALELFEQI